MAITSDPNSASRTSPRPPNRLHPPITAAGYGIDQQRPATRVEVDAVEARGQDDPPDPAMPLEILKTMIRTRATLMPARLAASALPPTA